MNSQGQSIQNEPLYNLIKQPYAVQPAVPWPEGPADDKRPLSGIKVLELARAIAAPTIGRVLSALGATVIRVSSATNTELPITLVDGCLGKISVDINLKTFEGRKTLLKLIEDADVFIDGYRPAVLEHLGFGRDAVFGLVDKRDKGIIYCQENCYGWKGPWIHRPGWAQISDAVGFPTLISMIWPLLMYQCSLQALDLVLDGLTVSRRHTSSLAQMRTTCELPLSKR